MYGFLSDTNQLYENQYGFREKHSCEHAIGQVIGKLVKGLENNMYGACVLLDLSKAFDTIEHSILLKKLELYGIRGNALKWFESYLSHRTIRVKCRTLSDSSETKSEDFVVTHGTPQGSCLGPLIFLIFVNDLHLHLNDSECIQFADDTTLVFVHRNLKYLQFCIQQEIFLVQDWFNANKLTLNIDKSSYLLYHKKSQRTENFKIELNGVQIPRVRSAKFLGTWIDDQLSWETHITKLINKLKCGLGMLCRSKNFLSTMAKRMLYYSQIHSNLSYCLGIWGTMSRRAYLDKLAKIQKKAIKQIAPMKKVNSTMLDYKILSIDSMITLEQCKLGYKLCHNLLPGKMSNDMMTDHQNKSTMKVHNYNTRNKSTPNLPTVTGSKYRSSFLFQSISNYISLDLHIRNSPTINSFVRHCKGLLLTKQAAS